MWKSILLLLCGAAVLLPGAARSQTVPALPVAPLASCEDRGGWIDGESGLCLVCPTKTPERSGEDPLGRRACTKPAGYEKIRARSRMLRVVQQRETVRVRCDIDETRRGNRCYRCPVLTFSTQDPRFCRRFSDARFAKAQQVDPKACAGGLWLGADGHCYRCPIGSYRMTDQDPSDQSACHLDLKGEMKAVFSDKWTEDLDRRARAEAVLAAAGPRGGPTGLTGADRIALMRDVLTDQRKGPSPPRVILWLVADPAVPGRSAGVAMQGLGRNPIKWSCMTYEARTDRLLASDQVQPAETLLLGWGSVKGLNEDRMIGYIEPQASLGGSYQGYDWLKFPTARRLVWEFAQDAVIGGTPAPGYYRHMILTALGDDAQDCDTVAWP